jgi:anti-sigma regulatory factor (Ser/Thr protein kinase)
MTERAFPAASGSVGAARQFLADCLTGFDSTQLANAQLMVSELATNAVVHASTVFTVTVTRRATSALVAVHDTGGGLPAVRPPAPDAVNGRGLRIVRALSSDWGVDTEPDGKTVWFEIPSGPADLRTDATAEQRY